MKILIIIATFAEKLAKKIFVMKNVNELTTMKATNFKNMKKLLIDLIKNKKKLQRAIDECQVVKDSVYYENFSTETKKIEDIFIYKQKIRQLLNREFTILENLQIAIELKKADNQYKLRKT
jgi:hypothetical protein